VISVDWGRHRGPAILWVVLVGVLAALAVSIDVPRTGYGIKSDESTYIAAALSAAYDGDLSFDRRDLERFAGLYHSGPEGIFLKRGKTLKIRLRPPFPFVHTFKQQDPNPNRLYFGKAILYPVAAAPFVRLLGLNGILVFHVLLLGLVAGLGYAFLAAECSTVAAVLFTTAFLGASVLPVYGVFLMPEIFNFALVFVAYFLWLYKEVAARRSTATEAEVWSAEERAVWPRIARGLQSPWSDVAAAVLLGLGTYSKPIPIGVLVGPLVALALLRRRYAWGVTLGAVAVAVAALGFAWNAAISGEFNYQGGDRKTFYAAFPFDAQDATWERRGGSVQTNGEEAQKVLTSGDTAGWFVHNLEYFVAGRHFGFVPYFFPGVVAILAWLASPARRDAWRILTFLAFAGAVVVLLLVLPFTWSGGGGPPGNRYLFNVYPALFFLIPPAAPTWLGVLAWLGGALFTAKMVANPFVAAKYTWLTTEKGAARRLPVELPMANDLPVMLAQPLRGRVHYGPYDENGFLLYFLDQNSWPPEPQGMWISGSGRTDIIVRTVKPIGRLTVEMQSPIHTTVTVAVGSTPVTVALEPQKIVTVEVPASGVRGFQGYAYLMTARSSDGFVPHLMDYANMDYRNLGAQLRFRMAQ
jgi:hypothetical protein